MASRFLPSDVGGSIPGSSFSTPLLFNGYHQFGGTLSGSGLENSSSDVRRPGQEIARADVEWRYEHEARVMRELMRVKSIESTAARPIINSNMLYSTHGHRFGYEQLNPFLGYTASASAVNSMPRQRQETGNFTEHGNEVFSHYASSHNRDFRETRVLRWSQANIEGNFPIMELPEADSENKLTAVRARVPESEIPGNIPLRHCPEGSSHEGKRPRYGGVTSGNVQIFHRPQPSITRELPSDNHSVSEILIKAWRKENLTDVSAAKELYSSVNSESHLRHHLDSIENSSPGRPACSTGPALPENSKKRKRMRCRLRKSMKKKTHSALETQSSIPGNKAVEKLSCSVGKAEPSSLCSVEVHAEGNKHNAEGGSSIATKGIKKRRRFRLRKSMKKKTHSALETQSSIPGDKAVEELSCSFSKAEPTSLCSMEVHGEGKKHDAEGASSIATKGIKKVKYATKNFKDGMNKVKNVKKVSKTRKHDRKFWCEMCNVEGINETLMLIHRNGRKHLKMLRKNHGAVLVVSSNEIDKTKNNCQTEMI